MRPFLLAAGVLVAVVLTSSAASEALVEEPARTSCAVGPFVPSCIIACAPFFHVQVEGIGGYGTVSASCGGATAACTTEYDLCTDTSASPARSFSLGQCTWTSIWEAGFGICVSPAFGTGAADA
jgi:opacity protein-like surface antigen